MPHASTASTATNPDLINTQGIIIETRKHGSATTVPWTDYGYVYDPTATNDTTTTELTGNRDGVNVVVKSAVTAFAKSWSFGTVSLSDDIRALHIGSDLTTSGVVGLTGVKGGSESASATTVEMIIIRKVVGGPHIVFYYPSVSIRGDGEGEQEGFTRLNFVATVTADATFSPPDTIIDFDGETMPYGVFYIVPDDDLQDVLDALNAIGTA